MFEIGSGVTLDLNLNNGLSLSRAVGVSANSDHLNIDGGIQGTIKVSDSTNGQALAVGLGAYKNSGSTSNMSINGGISGTITVSGSSGSAANAESYAMGLYVPIGTLSLGGGLSGTVSATMSASYAMAANNAYGLYGGSALSLSGGLSGAVSATAATSDAYNPASANAFGLYSGSTLSLSNGLSGTVNATATHSASSSKNADGTAYAIGLFSDNKGSLSLSEGLSGTVTASANATKNGNAYAYGLYSSGALNGGSASTPLSISGVVSASANSTAVAVYSANAANLSVTGTLSGVDTSGSNGYAIQVGSGSSLILGTGANLVGKVNLGGSSSVTLLGTGSSANLFQNVTNLVAGDGSTATSWTLNPLAANASTYGNLTINSSAALTINENVAITGNTVDNGSLTFNLGSNMTYAGAISGSGSLTNAGAATLTLTGNNTYSGGTTFAAGTVSVPAYSNLGTGPYIFSGGTLMVDGIDVSQGTIPVHAAGVVYDTTTRDQTISAIHSGSGSLTKIGSGLLTLTGDSSTYTGTLTHTNGKIMIAPGAVLGGSAIVATGGTLGGSGTVGNLTSSGTVTPGGSIGTLTVAGNYTQSASGMLLAEVSPSTSDLLRVAGSASLNGTLTVAPEQAFYATGTTRNILTAAGGVSGSFAHVAPTSGSWNLIFTPRYTADGVSLTVSRLSYATPARSSRAASVGAGLDGAAATATGEIATLLATLDYSSPARTDDALNILSPESYDADTQALLEGGWVLTSAQRSALHGEIGTGSLAVAGAQGMASGGATRLEEGQYGMFLQPFGLQTRQSDDADRTGYEADTGGLTGGVLFRPTANLTIGIAPAFMSQSVTLRSNRSGSGSSTIQDLSLALLGAYRHDAWYADAVARVGLNTFESSRSLVLPGVSRTAKGRWNGWNTSLSVGGGYDFKAGEYSFGPIASIDWQYLDEDGFTETGAGTLGQHIGTRQNHSLKTMVGARMARTFETAHGTISPELRAGWGAQWLDQSQGIESSFIDAPLSSYRAEISENAYDAVIVDVGASMRFTSNLTASVRAGLELFRPNHEAQAINVSLEYLF
ncbi:autotransporter domain-containing protein [uncultured Thiocystis sp.]|uniref:autotransporter outer membrane beta-barrel domain-containing protein n=1 Tax=uncultured Thiocystis sp. TaxID=1202134 RepID=UPI0025DF0355|nr:autotransporter domain-containing protein [uncultured Thiocystis sp.]